MKKLITTTIFILFAFMANAQFWSPVYIDTNFYDFRDIVFTQSGKGFLVGESANRIYFSNNGGISWNSNDTIKGKGVNAICFPTDSIGIAAGSDGIIHRTNNAGLTWDSIEKPANVALFGIYFLNVDTGYVVGKQGKIYKTVNSGYNWTALSSGTTASLWDVYFIDKNIGIIVADGRILRTTSGGNTWCEIHIDNIKQYKSIDFVDSLTGYIAGSLGEIFKTTDAGLTWTDIFLGADNKHFKGIYFESMSYGYAVGLSGIMYRTLDGGKNWQSIVSGTITHLETVYIHNNDTAFALGENGTVLINTQASGVGEMKNPEFQINIFPNPSSGLIVIKILKSKGEKIEIGILNYRGQEIFTTYVTSNQNEILIPYDLSYLSKGIYLIRIRNSNSILTKKIVLL